MAKTHATPATIASIAKVLQDTAQTKNVDFTLNRIRVTPVFIAEVGKAISAGKIKVVLDPSIGHDIVYNVKLNELQLKIPLTTALLTRALLVHESVHAINDMRKLGKTPNADDETVAFVAQAIYLRTNHPNKSQRLLDPNPAVDLLFEKAFIAADAIIAKQNAVTVNAAMAGVATALKAVPHYKKTINMSALHDGI